jgi:hypothetical protein
MKGGLRYFAQGCPWRRSRMRTVDGPNNKYPTVKTSGLRGVYNEFHAHF